MTYPRPSEGRPDEVSAVQPVPVNPFVDRHRAFEVDDPHLDDVPAIQSVTGSEGITAANRNTAQKPMYPDQDVFSTEFWLQKGLDFAVRMRHRNSPWAAGEASVSGEVGTASEAQEPDNSNQSPKKRHPVRNGLLAAGLVSAALHMTEPDAIATDKPVQDPGQARAVATALYNAVHAEDSMRERFESSYLTDPKSYYVARKQPGADGPELDLQAWDRLDTTEMGSFVQELDSPRIDIGEVVVDNFKYNLKELGNDTIDFALNHVFPINADKYFVSIGSACLAGTPYDINQTEQLDSTQRPQVVAAYSQDHITITPTDPLLPKLDFASNTNQATIYADDAETVKALAFYRCTPATKVDVSSIDLPYWH